MLFKQLTHRLSQDGVKMDNKIAVNLWLILLYYLALTTPETRAHANLQQQTGGSDISDVDGTETGTGGSFAAATGYGAFEDDENFVMINKCCEKFEIRIDSVCSQVNKSGMYRQRMGIETKNLKKLLKQKPWLKQKKAIKTLAVNIIMFF